MGFKKTWKQGRIAFGNGGPLLIFLVNGLHLYDKGLQLYPKAWQLMPLIYPFTHTKWKAAMQGAKQLVGNKWR